MATAADQAVEDGDKEELDTGPEGEGQEQQEDEGNGDDSPYAPLAKDMGWVPRDQYDGPAENWKDAERFIRDGRDIQRETSRELKTVRQQLDTLSRTSASIVEQQVRERVGELEAKYAKAVDDGDPREAFKIAGEIHALTSEQSAGPRQPSGEAQAWAERNSGWFRKPGFEYATARAIQITNELQRSGYTDHGQQLRIAEQRLRKEMPELFGRKANGKPAAAVNSPQSRSSGVSNRKQGFSDLPPEAQKVARDMADRGVIGNVDDYAKNYFANQAAKR
jgi:hypothetical protein